MVSKSLKNKVHEAIDHVESEALLKAVYVILTNDIRKVQEAIVPYTVEDLKKRQQKSKKDIAQGKIKEHEKVKMKYRS